MLRKKNSPNAYIIYGAFIFMYSVQQRVPRIWQLISEELSVKHRYLDAAFYEPRSNCYYFFKDNLFYRDNNDIGNPIQNLFRRSGFDMSTRIDAAVSYDGHVYIFKEEAVYKYRVTSNNTFAKEDQMRVTSFMYPILPHINAATVIVFDEKDLIYVVKRNFLFVLNGIDLNARHESKGARSYHNRIQYQALDCSHVAAAVIEDQSKQIEQEAAKITFTSTTPLNVEIHTTSTTSQSPISIFSTSEQPPPIALETLLPPPLTYPQETPAIALTVAINQVPKEINPITAKIRTKEKDINLFMMMSFIFAFSAICSLVGIAYLIRSKEKGTFEYSYSQLIALISKHSKNDCSTSKT
ncbi:hypothetical protein B4U79_17561 [Dinothrombium tinctorium]|uniref:Uncharacterized protein n=1 Tax=Dinothrombium tinctorium TaxID=1965070 RepID=A0A443R750_9ACAR|nr:hypothetical protein B4U79_17561 [Dinothrombium tinctorium]